MSNVAFLLANDFEDSEMKVPYDEIIKAGHQADIIGLKKGRPCWVKRKKSPTQQTRRSPRFKQVIMTRLSSRVVLPREFTAKCRYFEVCKRSK